MTSDLEDGMSDNGTHEAVLRVLRLLADRLEAYLDGDDTSFETLGESLEQADVSADDLQAAALVLRTLQAGGASGASDAIEHEPAAEAHRVLSQEERAILAPEAWGYLLWLKSRGSLDAGQCERVLDLVSGSGVRPVGVEHVREAAVRIAMASDDDGRGEGAPERSH